MMRGHFMHNSEFKPESLHSPFPCVYLSIVVTRLMGKKTTYDQSIMIETEKLKS